MRKIKILNFWKIVLSCFICLIFFPTYALPQETYVFERMWPTLQQPWYFSPTDVAIDQSGNIYIANCGNSTVTKLNSDGQFITEWGPGYAQGWRPMGIDLDPSGNVYILDIEDNAVHKFTPNGQFIARWGSQGSGDGQFDLWDQDNHIAGGSIAIDSNGLVYVADTLNHRIQKFTSDGQFITKWGTSGTGNGQFDRPTSIAVDGNGNVYVVDTYNSRIQKFTSDGVFIDKWGSYGLGEGEFIFQDEYGGIRAAITIDESGYIFVANGYQNVERIQKFTSDGQFVTTFGSFGNGDRELYFVRGMDTDRSGNIFVAEEMNHRIQKFTPDGQFITKWGASGFGDGEFNSPIGIALDGAGNVYVAEANHSRIQKFSSNGQFIATWGDSSPYGMMGITCDGNGNIYLVDVWQSRILKYDSNGNFIAEWGNPGSGNGQFDFGYTPTDIAIDGSGNVYVVDTDNHRVQKFKSNGEFITWWGGYGSDPGQFNFEWHDGAGIAIDHANGWVYVTDESNDRIQKFDLNGNFLLEWNQYGDEDWEVISNPRAIAVDSSGYVYVSGASNVIWKFNSNGEFIAGYAEEGTAPGQLNGPHDLCIAPNGKIYVADSGNDRVQVFKKVTEVTNTKAIIVAGGGPFAGNNLWNATQMCANFAYRTLTYQGFTKETIYYLTSDTDLDLDHNGELDDVDGDAANSNLQQAIAAAAGAENLVIYLVDHGGSGTFRMSGTETLSASDLDSWLDTVQTTITGEVIVVYDACESGSFVASLTPPPGKERIVITSTSQGESAYFVAQGSVSFSSFFWTHIFNGFNIKAAFDPAKAAIGLTTANQNPLLDDNGNGIGNEGDDGVLAQNTYIGNGTEISGEVPVIGSVSPAQTINNTNSALLYAGDVTDTDGIARVWAIIYPPDYNQGSADNPVYSLPSIDLMPVDGNPDRYEVTYEDFSITGTYQIVIYARDRIGNTASPQITTVVVNSPLSRKAIIVAGSWQADQLWPAVEKNAAHAYRALTFQGYSDNDIYLMSSEPISDAVVDSAPTFANLTSAISTWAQTDTQDVVLYLVVNGNTKTFRINQTENLSADELDTLLDDLQSNIPGKVTVVYDACRSGSFLSSLTPPAGKERILIAGTSSDQPAYFLSDGVVSFSWFFWWKVSNGASVRDSFLHAKNAISFLSQNQTPKLDDNGNGIGNEKSDGQIARYYTLGVGIMLAGDDPIIGSISPDQTVDEGGSATIWVEDVTTTGTIDKVWAVITPPDYSADDPSNPVTDLPVVDLSDVGGGRYQGIYGDFSTYGTYQAAVYAMDTDGNISMPKETSICYVICSDNYEENDTFSQANVIVISDETAQHHNFNDSADEDWVKFYGVAGEIYTIEVGNPGTYCDAVIELYDTDGTTMLLPEPRDDGNAGEGEYLDWTCLQNGIYYVMIKQSNPNDFGENTEYDLKVYRPVGTLPGFIVGTILDSCSGESIKEAIITTNNNASTISLPDGSYLMVLPAGSFTVTVEIPGYYAFTIGPVTVDEAGIVTQNIAMVPETVSPIDSGWNLISLPLTPSNTDPSAVLAGILGSYSKVYGFDNTDKSWKQYDPDGSQTLTSMTSGRGYWIYVTNAGGATLNVTGSNPSTSHTLQSGWNLISYDGTDGTATSTADDGLGSDYSKIYGFDNSTKGWKQFDPDGSQTLTTLENGKGYWIYITNESGATWNQ